MTADTDIVANLAEIRARVAAAAAGAGRDPKDITLVAVGKTFPAEIMRRALVAGQRVFGENRVQEAADKWPALKAEYPDIELHLIGPLQSNKIRDAIGLFDMIETVDREKIARRLAEEMTRSGRRVPCLIQVNTGEEPQKAGVPPEAVDDFVDLCRGQLSLPIEGLMCIPPVEDEPSLHFALLAEIARRNGLSILSMGMSADFDVAIQFGATHVRVGSAIFGARGKA